MARKNLVPYGINFGTSNYVTAGNSSGLNVAFPEVTVEAWVNRTSHAIEGEIAGKHYSGYELGVVTDNRIKFDATINGTQATYYSTQNAAGTITDGTWYHVAAVYDGANVNIFKNGVEVSNAAYATNGNMGTNAIPFNLAARNNVAQWFDGRIAEVRIWNKGLAPADIAIHAGNARDVTSANTPSCSYAANCVLHYPMDQERGAGTVIFDVKGNNIGTFGGSPTWITTTDGIPASRSVAAARTAAAARSVASARNPVA